MSFYIVKRDSKNTSFLDVDNESYLIIDQYFFGSKWYNYEDSYTYYNIIVNNRLPYKKSDNEYVIRYNDTYKSTITALQVKIKNFFGEIEVFTNDDKVIFIYSDGKELFKKRREIVNIKLYLLNLYLLN